MRLRSGVGWVLVAGLGLGCATGDGMQSKLREATSAYNRSMRWGDIDRAAEYLPVAAQDDFMSRHEAVRERLVIVDYELSRLEFDPRTGVAACRAEVSWHTERELILRTTVVDQVWQFHRGDFVLVDERRAGGTPLSVFANAEEDPHPYLPGLERYRKTHQIGEENKEKRKRRRKRTSAHASAAG